MKILLPDKATLLCNNDLSLDIFATFGEVLAFENLTKAELLDVVCDVDVILCNKTVIDREVFAFAKKLKYIGTFATGYNNIDITAAAEYGVVVCNAPEYSTNAVAQQVIGYILMHYTKIAEYDTFVKNGGWKRSPTFSPLVFSTDEVFGKTLGIVGFGSIGKAVATAARGLGMNVIVFTRTPRVDGVTTFVSLDELLRLSDVVTLHCPLNEQSADMMNAQAFAKMKNGAFFVNTSRGGTVDEKALFDALVSGKLSGAAVDVLKQEPMSDNCILANAPNLIITPHTAWAPLSTRERLVRLVADNLTGFLNGNLKNRVV